MKYLFLMLLFSIVNVEAAQGLDKVNEDFMKHVKHPAAKFTNLQQLHDYLVKPAKNKRERAELFFYWISQHIEYDINKYESVLSGKKAEKYDVFQAKKGVCEDYSNLFKALCDLSEIECYFIAGYSKAGFEPGKALKIDHAWNIVQLDGKYEFVDCTWGSGEVIMDVNGKRQYRKDLDLSQVFVNSNKFREYHLPGSAKWQLLEHPVSYTAFVENTEFEKMQAVTNTPFNFRDSIAQFSKLSEEIKPAQEKVDAYHFHSTYKNAFECGKNYEIIAYRLATGDYDLENLKRAKGYYGEAKKWYVTSFNITNGTKRKANRNQIELIKNVNKRIKNCEFRILARK